METVEIQISEGVVVGLSKLAEQVGTQLKGRVVADFLRGVIAAGHAEDFKDLFEILEIVTTPSNFNGEIESLVRVATEYSLEWWLKQTGRILNRETIIVYWDFFMTMAGETGFVPSGYINLKGQTTNLWKATGDLFDRMNEAYRSNCSTYGFLPGGYVNNAELVQRTLSTLKSPVAFIELLVGDVVENVPDWFFGAFSIFPDKKNREGCMATIMIALQQS